MTDYEEYLEKFCSQYHVSKEQAESMAIVKEVKAHLESKPADIIPTVDKVDCGC